MTGFMALAFLASPVAVLAQDSAAPEKSPEPVGSTQPVVVADPLAGNQKSEQQAPPAGSVLQTNSGATTGTMAVVPPPAPGGGVMENGSIPPISADMLALTPEEQQEMALQNARTQVFDNTLKNALPLEPAEIKNVIERYEQTTKAVETPFAGKPPTPEIRVETISLEPSAIPPVVRLAPGHVTSLTLLDATGQPWPISDVSWGGDFEVTEPDQDGGHIVSISPLGGYKTGNIALRLLGLPTPITFTLQTQPDFVDYRFDARVPLPGPNALTAIIDTPTPTQAGDGNMMMVLDGTPPEGSVQMAVSGVDGRTSAYKVGAKVYVRTPYNMLSPAWSEQSASADGMKVYVIPESPVLLLSDQGKMVRASVAAAQAVGVPEDEKKEGAGL